MAKSDYYLQARLFPTVLTVIPLLILVNTLISDLYSEALRKIFDVLPTITNLGLSAALLFLMIQVNRFVSKEIFQKIIFKDEIWMPTTNHLLWKDQFFDNSIKEKVRKKISQKYEISLLSEEEESINELNARRIIVSAVSQIRNTLRDNKLLLQHNIEYGFFRNLIGGCALAVFFSIPIFVYGFLQNYNSLKITGLICVFVYLIPILFSKLFIKRYGNYYSKILYEQFLSI
jgi:hypothetical protein